MEYTEWEREHRRDLMMEEILVKIREMHEELQAQKKKIGKK